MLGTTRQLLWPLLPCAVLRRCAAAAAAAALSTASSTQQPHKKPYISQKVKFVDQVRVVARGGQGGGGSSALFGRTGHHPRAAGGNGAPGGGVVLRATRQLTGLGSIPLHVEAERGGHGGKQWMDGKRGADTVVQVPLGTSVWRLVQLRGPGAVDTPHGVTPTPAAAAAAAAQHSTHYQHSSQQNEGSAAAGTPFSRQQHAQQDTASSAVPQQHRRRLFADDRLEAANTSSSNSAAQGDGSGAGAPDGSPTSSTCSSDASSSTISDAGHEQEQEHELNTGQRAAEALYEDLLSCRVALSNRQKLQLLHCGSLDDQAAAAAMLDWQDDSSEAEEGEGTGSDGDSASEQDDDDDDDDDDVEGFDGAAGSWQGQQQWSRAGSGARGLGEWGDAEERHFTKQQVWSILSAQAELLGVLESEGQELLVAAGGCGGRGNAVAPSNHQRPASKTRSDGHPGQEVVLLLQLRLMADIALVGLPNVGKSSLISALTAARAQVGSYAFTTLRPQLGALLAAPPDAGPAANEAQQQSVAQQPEPGPSGGQQGGSKLAGAAAAGGEDSSGLTGHQLVLADLPGLVPGAHEGKGRGIDFLRHLQKARCIALVLDLTGSSSSSGQVPGEGDDDGRDTQPAAGSLADTNWQEVLVPHSPEQQLHILLDELRSFDPQAMSKPMLVVANKVDALSAAAAAAALQRLKQATDLPIIPVSAQQHLGLVRLKQSLELVAGAAGVQQRS